MQESNEHGDSTFRERLRDRATAARIKLDADQLELLNRYFRLLRRWNRSINLTALPLEGAPNQTLDRLFIEPLQAAELVQNTQLLWIDCGSGGGSPAIPLKVARPRLDLKMVESRSRKAAFLGEAVRELTLSSVEVLPVRLEELSRSMGVGVGSVDLMTLRGVRLEAGLWRTAASLLRPSGRLFLFSSKRAGELPNLDGRFQVLHDRSLASRDSILQVLSRTDQLM